MSQFEKTVINATNWENVCAGGIQNSSDLQDSFRFLGLNVTQYTSHIVVNQETYAKSIKPTQVKKIYV